MPNIHIGIYLKENEYSHYILNKTEYNRLAKKAIQNAIEQLNNQN